MKLQNGFMGIIDEMGIIDMGVGICVGLSCFMGIVDAHGISL